MTAGAWGEVITEGMQVRSADGERLGRVQSVSGGTFYIEKGFFFPKEYVVSLDDVADLQAGEIILKIRAESLRAAGEGMPAAAPTATSAPAASPAVTRDDESISIPVAEERLDVAKRDREVGAVRVRKEVIEETRQIEVPVRREEVHVERVAASAETPASADAFSGEEIVVPVHEEEVEVSKRAVSRGEVRIRKDEHEEQRQVADSVRHEEVRVEGEGGVRNLDDLDPDRRS